MGFLRQGCIFCRWIPCLPFRLWCSDRFLAFLSQYLLNFVYFKFE
jgi:hypothetical protein